jgi:uroporphyrinogen-III synthase
MMKDKRNVLYLGLDPTRFVANGKITHYPIIKIVPRSVRELTPFFQTHLCWTHVILTSAAALKIFFDIAHTLQIDLIPKHFILVGKATAFQLSQRGDFLHTVAEEETGEGVVAKLKKMDLKNAHLFFPHSEQARTVITDFLINCNFTFAHCSLYDTMPNLDLPNLDLHHFDEIVFTSPSTVTAFHSLFGHVPKQVQLTAIGPITQKKLDVLKNLFI